MLKDLVRKARSYRRFQENKAIAAEVVADMVDLARYVPASSNKQVLRFAISTSPEMNARIFPNLAWAGLLKDWKGPAEGERPVAYIVIAGDDDFPQFHKIDTGIVAQAIQLALAEKGIGCCMLGSINAKAIHELMDFPANVSVGLVLAIGYPGETVVLEEMGPDQTDTTYYRDAEGTHHVPKRHLDTVLLRTYR